ncbi:MAG: acetyl-CoA decarbonylase/synthase complex subunit delta [Candidatus Aureabacteria bacterium]|nr:acetyl-CoA decarbonylase/synthase complex subunit delta [Candidatus Auribacterota bacterium]
MNELSDNWKLSINEVTIGATAADGGTRTSTVTIGGASGLPFLAKTPRRPRIAMEVIDRIPEDWPPVLLKPFRDLPGGPAARAVACVEKFGAELICLRLQSIHPDWGDASPEEAARTVKEVLSAVSAPVIVWGCDDAEKNSLALPACSQAAAGENCLIGFAAEKSYKTLAAACLADRHKLVAQSPIDINIAKQLNILISEMGFDPHNIVIDPLTGALGYGLEYTYSIMERIRLAALIGDRMLAMPIVCDVAGDAWKAKEAKTPAKEFPAWGDETLRGPLWEAMTASLLLQAGADLIIIRHPLAAKHLQRHIEALLRNET